MAVGGIGMLSTANYHARKFGVRSAMPGYIAKKLCPELVIVKPNFPAYVSRLEFPRACCLSWESEGPRGSLQFESVFIIKISKCTKSNGF